MNCIRFFIVVFGFSLWSACFYDVEELLYPGFECFPENMSLTNDIQPIFIRTCFVCHSSAARMGNVDLENYSELMRYVNNGSLIGSINHERNFTPMPENAPKLPACDIRRIEQWIEEGSLNN